jgi:ribosome hibernation promoting factor
VTLLTAPSIRVHAVALDDEDREYIRKRVRTLFRRYGRVAERVTVRVRDVNGPRGGVDMVCRVKVVLKGLPSVVVERRTPHLKSALSSALVAAAQAVSQTLRRRRMRPIRTTRRKTGLARQS